MTAWAMFRAAVGKAVGGGQRGVPWSGRRTTSRVLVLFLAPVDAVGRAIDRATGGLGLAHTAVDCGELGPWREPLVYDAHAAHGVVRARRADYARRVTCELELVGDAADYAHAQLRRRVGQPYALEGPATSSCATLVYRALLPELRDLVDAQDCPGRKVLSPNRIALAFGLVGQ